MTKFAYSLDEERYHGEFETREDAMIEGGETAEEGARVWTGEIVRPDLEGLGHGHAQGIVETIEERLGDICGEFAAGYPDYESNDLKQLDAKLANVIAEWLKGRVECFTVDNIREHSAEDIAVAIAAEERKHA